METNFTQYANQSNTFINAYNSQDINILTECLDNTDNRIKFENWMIDIISSEKGIDPAFSWHTKVLTLLCNKIGKDEKESFKQRNEEDSLLTNIISKIGLSSLINENTLDKNIDSEEQNYNLWQILAEIKNEILPETSELLLKMLKDKAIKDPQQFKSEMVNKDSEGMTPIHWIARINNLEMMQFITENKEFSEAFKAAILIKDKNENTPIHWATYNNNTEMVKLMFANAPEEVKRNLVKMNQFRNTPVNYLADENNIEMIKFFAKVAPAEFKSSMLISNSQNRIPIHYAASRKNTEMIKLMSESEPKALSILSDNLLVLDIVKMRRPHNYKEITKLYKQDPLLKIFSEVNREIAKRKAISHAFAVPGTSKLMHTDTKEELRTIPLEGHYPAQWFHMFSKDLNSFHQSYPDLQSDEQKALLNEAFELAANSASYSAEDKLKRINDGLPTFIDTGFFNHAVTLLIWGDQLIICNRGEASKMPIQIYHFNPEKLDAKILDEIEKVRFESEEAYKKLFFEILPEKLMFSQTDIDKNLEFNALTLSYQTMGNCSFVSPITAAYAYFMLERVRSVKEGRLLDIIPKNNNTQQASMESMSLYRTWLGFQQLTILERLIAPLKDSESNIESDYALIMEAIRKAYLIPLDEKGKIKLQEIVDKFIKSLKIEFQSDIKLDTLCWKVQGKFNTFRL